MATLMLFFLAHEMGHYLYCRRYGVYATLPFFIPAPTLIGTMGAVIRIRSPIRSRTALFDIGIAGPIAGFVVALAVLIVSLGCRNPSFWFELAGVLDLGFPLIFQSCTVCSRSMNLLQRSAALPLNRVLLHPVGDCGLGGDVCDFAEPAARRTTRRRAHCFFHRAAGAQICISRLTILILLPMAYYLWSGWLVWAFLLRLSSFRHPQVAEWPRVAGGRAWLAVCALLMLALTLTPAPFLHASMPDVLAANLRTLGIVDSFHRRIRPLPSHSFVYSFIQSF